MRVVCVGRHRFLSEHLSRFFSALGLDALPAVGMEEGAELVAASAAHVAICDYDLLATIPLDEWERDPLLGRIPVIAVSLTRRPDEAHLLDVNGIAGFLYLPQVCRADALRVVTAARHGRGVTPPAAFTLQRPGEVAPAR